jgi:Zn-dependent protease with chaperone function
MMLSVHCAGGWGVYNNFLYFIVVLLIFSTQQPGVGFRLSGPVTVTASLGLLALFALINQWVFRRLAARLAGMGTGTRAPVMFARTVGRLSLLALGFFALHIYLLDVKAHLNAFSLFRNSFTLQGVVGLGLFLLYLSMVWLFSNRYSPGARTRAGGAGGSLRFNLAILLPWLLISGVADLLRFVPDGFWNRGLDTPAGQVVFFAFLLLLFTLFGPPLVLRLWGCRPLPPGGRRALIEEFCRVHRFPVRDILLWPTLGAGVLTAGVMGLYQRWRYLLLTESLLALLDDNELRGVLAHELGHIRKFHLFFYLVFLLGYLVVASPLMDLSILFLLASNLPLDFVGLPDAGQVTLVSLLSTAPLLLLLVLYFRYLFGFFIRNFERQADLYALTVMGEPTALVSALEKVAFHSGDIREVPSWHHFSIKERVDFLLAAARTPALVRGHRGKVRAGLVLYMIAITFLGTGGYLIQSGAIGKNLSDRLVFRALDRQVTRSPENVRLRLALGTLYYQRQNLPEAVHHLELALKLDPDDPEVQNNLAWILATSKDSVYFQPERALTLAERAARISPEPYVLDTLAEAYHVNGRNKEALKAAEAALEAATTNHSYYIKQAERFRGFMGGKGADEERK